MVWYGWIPTLTKKVLFKYFIKKIDRVAKEIKEAEGAEKLSSSVSHKKSIEKEWTRPDEEDIELLDKLFKGHNSYYQCYIVSDDKEDYFKFIISTENSRINHAIIFNGHNKKSKPTVYADCDITDEGRVCIKLKSFKGDPIDQWTEYYHVKTIYSKIRDAYHIHTHHAKSYDLLLKPFEIPDSVEQSEINKYFVSEILLQYEEKIVGYLDLIKADLIPFKDNDEAREIITKSKGEMKYAMSFVRLFKKDIIATEEKDYDSYMCIFSNASECLNILADEIEISYAKNMTNIIAGFTIVIVTLTFPIAIDAIHGSSQYFTELFGWELNNIVLQGIVIIYLLILIWALSMLRKWITEKFRTLKDILKI